MFILHYQANIKKVIKNAALSSLPVFIDTSTGIK